jgi:hypothetical protein
MQIALTEDERRYAMSPQGASQLAVARHYHALAQRSKGDRAQPWSDALEAEATRNLAACNRWEDN